MGNNKLLKGFFCSIIATLLALTSHIYILKWIKPLQESMYPGMVPPLPNYDTIIVSTAYITAFIMITLKVFLYYHTQHLLTFQSEIIKFFFIAFIFLELSGNLIRQPIMDTLVAYKQGIGNPILYTVFNNIDKWIANILLAASIVYLCPKKIMNKNDRLY